MKPADRADAKQVARELRQQAKALRAAAAEVRTLRGGATASMRSADAEEWAGEALVDAARSGLLPELRNLARWIDAEGCGSFRLGGRPLPDCSQAPERRAVAVKSYANALALAASVELPGLNYAPRRSEVVGLLLSILAPAELRDPGSNASPPVQDPTWTEARMAELHREAQAARLEAFAMLLSRAAAEVRKAADVASERSLPAATEDLQAGGDWKPPRWYQDVTTAGLTAKTVRAAVSGGLLSEEHVRHDGGRVFVHVRGASRRWPEWADAIAKARRKERDGNEGG